MTGILTSDKERILAVDGLRTVAVMGVIWAHTWLFFGNPKFEIKGIDFSRLISFVGVGVDLFFVISGYCMFLMYGRKVEKLTSDSYVHFIKKRWLRIAPAYYVALVASSFIFLLLRGNFPLKELIIHLLTLNTIVPNTNIIAPPFWSLATEWHFYFILPFILFLAIKFGIKLVFALLIIIVLFFRFFTINDLTTFEFYNLQIYNQLIGFLWGILAAWLFVRKIPLPWILKGWKGVILAFSIAYFGRVLMTTFFFSKFGHWGYIFRTISEPVMTLGFALIIWNVITDKNIFSRMLSSSFFVKLGQLSYSLYLWHWYICIAVCYLVQQYLGKTFAHQQLAFLISVVISIPVAFLSFQLFESFYFKIHKKL